MTSTVTKLTARVIESGSQQGEGVVAVVLLIVLLLAYQVIRALGDPRASQGSRVYMIAIAPLLVAFAAVVVTRLIDVVHTS